EMKILPVERSADLVVERLGAAQLDRKILSEEIVSAVDGLHRDRNVIEPQANVVSRSHAETNLPSRNLRAISPRAPAESATVAGTSSAAPAAIRWRACPRTCESIDRRGTMRARQRNSSLASSRPPLPSIVRTTIYPPPLNGPALKICVGPMRSTPADSWMCPEMQTSGFTSSMNCRAAVLPTGLPLRMRSHLVSNGGV